MKFLLTSSGISNPSITTRWWNYLANRLPSRAHSAFPPGPTRFLMEQKGL